MFEITQGHPSTKAKHLRIIVIVILRFSVCGIKPEPPNLRANELQQEQWLVGGRRCSFVLYTEEDTSGNDRILGPVVLWNVRDGSCTSELSGIDRFEKLLRQEESVTILGEARCRHREFFDPYV